MTTQTVSSSSTTTTAQSSLLKRIGMSVYRVLEPMTEGAYKSYQAQQAPFYGTI